MVVNGEEKRHVTWDCNKGGLKSFKWVTQDEKPMVGLGSIRDTQGPKKPMLGLDPNCDTCGLSKYPRVNKPNQI